MKQILLILTILISLNSYSQFVPSPVKVETDTMTCIEWFNLYNELNKDITYIKFKSGKSEVLVHEYKCGLTHVTFSQYWKDDMKNGVKITKVYWRIRKNMLVKI